MDTKKVRELVNGLIKDLYLKNGHTSIRKLRKYGLEKEAVNWGGLGAREIWYSPEDDRYLVFIEEADPFCPEFHGYISSEMQKKGFEVEVQTEW